MVQIEGELFGRRSRSREFDRRNDDQEGEEGGGVSAERSDARLKQTGSFLENVRSEECFEEDGRQEEAAGVERGTHRTKFASKLPILRWRGDGSGASVDSRGQQVGSPAAAGYPGAIS